MNRLQSLPQELLLISNNLPCGYFRDLQELKEAYLPAFDQLTDCLDMACYIVERISVNEHILDDPRYDAMFSVEEVNRLAAAGTPFRDAYKQVGLAIEAGTFRPDKHVRHTHAGSLGNLCNDCTARRMEQLWQEFGFDRVEAAEQALLA